MDHRITFTHPDGSAGIITPAPEMFDAKTELGIITSPHTRSRQRRPGSL